MGRLSVSVLEKCGALTHNAQSRLAVHAIDEEDAGSASSLHSAKPLSRCRSVCTRVDGLICFCVEKLSSSLQCTTPLGFLSHEHERQWPSHDFSLVSVPDAGFDQSGEEVIGEVSGAMLLLVFVNGGQGVEVLTEFKSGPAAFKDRRSSVVDDEAGSRW